MGNRHTNSERLSKQRMDVFMKKKLNEMTLEELWELFPISLVPHKTCWSEWFYEEKELLEDLLTNVKTLKIEHIGSTTISTIYAKNIVDILIEVENEDYIKTSNLLSNNGYIIMYQKENRAALNKGYTEDGFAEKVFHVHVRKKGDIDELYFRDYLIEYKEVAKDYEKLKLELWKRYEHDRDGYTDAKTEFITSITEKAKSLYHGRY